MKYYRVTYRGEGIYNALKKYVGLDTWKKILASKDISWLPKPPSYGENNISYFTEEGYKKFLNRTMPIVSKYLNEEDIKVDVLDVILDNVLYFDEYQIVVEII